MFEASYSIQLMFYPLRQFSTPFNRCKTHHLCVNRYRSNMMYFFAYCFWLLQLIFPLWVGGFETKCQMDTLCGNMSMDVTPCVYLSVYL